MRNSSTSSIVGIDGDAPFLVTAIAEAAEAILSASSAVFPNDTDEIKNPVKVSPAAVVSIALTRKIPNEYFPSLPLYRAPLSPSVRTVLIPGAFFQALK